MANGEEIICEILSPRNKCCLDEKGITFQSTYGKVGCLLMMIYNAEGALVVIRGIRMVM